MWGRVEQKKEAGTGGGEEIGEVGRDEGRGFKRHRLGESVSGRFAAP